MTDLRLQPRQPQDDLPKNSGSSSEPLTYTPHQVSKMLPLGLNQTYDAIRKGVIPSIRVGRRILVPRQRLLELLNGGGFDAA
jgi:excisionase family DNA binding protein